MAINSRAKGANGEKQAIQWLKQWTGYQFVRVPLSGGLRWKNTTNSVGDIICDEPNTIFPFSIEVKFVRDINFEHLLYHRGSKERKISRIKQFWFQARNDARRGKKNPMLMMRYNGMPKAFFFIVMGYNDVEYLKENGLSFEPCLTFDKKICIFTTRSLDKATYEEIEYLMLKRLKDKYGR